MKKILDNIIKLLYSESITKAGNATTLGERTMSNTKNNIVESDATVEAMYSDYIDSDKNNVFMKVNGLSIHAMNHHKDLVTLSLSTPVTSSCHHLTVKSARALATGILEILGGE